MNSQFGEVFMFLTKLAWKSRLTIPVLITTAFLIMDVRLQIEINIHSGRVAAADLDDLNDSDDSDDDEENEDNDENQEDDSEIEYDSSENSNAEENANLFAESDNQQQNNQLVNDTRERVFFCIPVRGAIGRN